MNKFIVFIFLFFINNLFSQITINEYKVTLDEISKSTTLQERYLGEYNKSNVLIREISFNGNNEIIGINELVYKNKKLDKINYFRPEDILTGYSIINEKLENDKIRIDMYNKDKTGNFVINNSILYLFKDDILYLKQFLNNKNEMTLLIEYNYELSNKKMIETQIISNEIIRKIEYFFNDFGLEIKQNWYDENNNLEKYILTEYVNGKNLRISKAYNSLNEPIWITFQEYLKIDNNIQFNKQNYMKKVLSKEEYFFSFN